MLYKYKLSDMKRCSNCSLKCEGMQLFQSVMLISINMGQTCGLTLFAKQRWTFVTAANSQVLLKAKQQSAIYRPTLSWRKKNNTNISVTAHTANLWLPFQI